MSTTEMSTLFGRLSLESLPLHEPIVVGTFIAVALGGLALLGVLTYFRLWGYLNRSGELRLSSLTSTLFDQHMAFFFVFSRLF